MLDSYKGNPALFVFLGAIYEKETPGSSGIMRHHLSRLRAPGDRLDRLGGGLIMSFVFLTSLVILAGAALLYAAFLGLMHLVAVWLHFTDEQDARD